MKKKHSLAFKIKRLLQNQAVKTQQNLSLILLGFALSLVGIGLVMGGEYLVSGPLERELVALLGIIIITVSCILALIGYISLSLLRIFYVITQEDSADDESATPPEDKNDKS